MKKIEIIAVILLFIIAGFYLYHQKENWFSPAQVYIPSNELKQGDTLLIKIDSPVSEEKITGEFNFKKIDFFQATEKIKVAILGIDVNDKPGRHVLIINLPSGNLG